MATSQRAVLQGDESIEYRTMMKNRPSLIELLSHSIQSLGDELLAAKLIPSELYHTVQESTNSHRATRNVINCLTAQIKINISIYHKFIGILKKLDPWTNSVIKNMTDDYDTLLSSFEQTSSYCDASGGKTNQLATSEIK